MPSVCRLPPVAHQISMITPHIRAKSNVVFKPLQCPCTRNLPFMATSVRTLPEILLDMRWNNGRPMPSVTRRQLCIALECTESKVPIRLVSRSLRSQAFVSTVSTYGPDGDATNPPSFSAYKSPSPLIHPAFV